MLYDDVSKITLYYYSVTESAVGNLTADSVFFEVSKYSII